MTRRAALLLSLFALGTSPALAVETWDVTQPTDSFVTRSGVEDLEAVSAGDVGVVLPSWHRRPLYLAYRAFTLAPEKARLSHLAGAEEVARRKAADRRGGAVKAWVVARGRTLADHEDWDESGAARSFGPGVLGGYVNCAPDAFRLAVDTLAALQGRKGVKPADVEAWAAAQDWVFSSCSREVATAAPADPAAAPAPSPAAPPDPRPLPATAAPYLHQLREYQLAAARFYAGDHAGAQARFEAIARTPGHAMRGWAAVGALRSVVRAATLDLGWERAWAAARAPGADPERARAALAEARERARAVDAKAAEALRAGAAAYLAVPALAPTHEVVRRTLDDGLRALAPRAWWTLAAGRLADLERHPEEDDGTLFRWADVVGEALEADPEPELGELRSRHAFVDWIATIQGCADNPASPHARGRCPQEHAHALETWARTQEPAWLVAALVTARALTPSAEPALRAALALPEDSPAWFSARFHAARLLARAGRREEALPVVEAGLARSASGPHRARSTWHLFVQERLALVTSVRNAGPYLARRVDRGLAVLGADGRRLLNQVASTEDLLALAASPDTPEPLQRELLLIAWFRAHLSGKAALAQEAARRSAEVMPGIAKRVAELYQTNQSALRELAFQIAVAEIAASPTAGWRRGRARTALFCTFDPAHEAPQEAAERSPPTALAPTDPAELARLRALGYGPESQAERLLAALADVPLSAQTKRALLQGALDGLESDGCPSPDAARLRPRLERAIAALK